MRSVLILGLFFALQAGYAQDLQAYIRMAEEQNPELQAYRLRYNLAEEKVAESNWLPGTELSAGFFVSEPETRTGAQKARFSARQMLPWFGTLSTREAYARSMAETDYQAYEVARRKLALEVTRSFHELYRLNAQMAVMDRNMALLSTYEQLALTSLEVARASAVDVLRLQIRQNEIQEQKSILLERINAERVQFNALLNREVGADILVDENAGIPVSDPLPGTGIGLNPELLQYDKLYASVALAEELNQKESAPAIGVGIDYVAVQERPDMSFSDNGKDILMPMVSLKIPLFDNRFASRSRQNTLRQQELEALKIHRKNVLETALARAVTGRNGARIRYETQERNLAKAKDAENLLLRSYETGTIDFRDVLDLQELQLKFQLNRIEAVADYYKQSAVIHYIANPNGGN